MNHNPATALSQCEVAWAGGGYLVARRAALKCLATGQGKVTIWDDGQIIVRGRPFEAVLTVHYFPDGRRVAIPAPAWPRPRRV